MSEDANPTLSAAREAADPRDPSAAASLELRSNGEPTRFGLMSLSLMCAFIFVRAPPMLFLLLLFSIFLQLNSKSAGVYELVSLTCVLRKLRPPRARPSQDPLLLPLQRLRCADAFVCDCSAEDPCPERHGAAMREGAVVVALPPETRFLY